MTVEIVYDASNFISASIEEVFKTIGEAALIVIVVILLFLGSFRSVLIPIVTIPLSLVGVCFVLFALGYSINLLTLLAMVLAIGLVVDDAIVVLENIHRHIEEGLKPVDAAIVGMKEIFGPIVSMTITLAAVYAPIGFTQGLTGTLFREFAFTLAGAVVISGIIAVTLVADDVRHAAQAAWPWRAEGLRGFRRPHVHASSRTGIRAASAGSLDYRPVTLVIVAALLGTTVFLFMKTPSELAPEEDQGAFLGLVNAPQYATADYTQAFAAGFTRAGEKIPEIDDTFLIAGIDGGGSGFVGFKLKEWSERQKKGGARPSRKSRICSTRMRACRRSSSRPRRCPAPVAACRSSMFCGPSAIPPRPTRSASKCRRRRRPRASSSWSQNSMTLRDAARPHHRGSRPSGSARRAGERDRHHARRAGRRRVDLQVRPR